MPWLKSSVSKLYDVYVTENDYKPLKSLLTEAAEKNYVRVIYKGKVVEVGEVFRVLSEIDREEFEKKLEELNTTSKGS